MASTTTRALPRRRRGWIDVPNAPPIPGLRFRFYAGEADIPAMVEVTNRFNESVGETDHWTEEMLAVELRHASHVPPQEGMLLAFVGDRMVAYSSVEYADTSQGERHYRSLGNLDPAWRRQGLGSAMMAFNERLLRELAELEGFPGARALLTWVDDQNAGGSALARQRGYHPTRVFHHMTRPDMEGIETPPLPPGIEVRPMSRELLPRYWAAAVEAFGDHYGGHDFSDEAYRRFVEDPLLDLELFVTAFDGDEIVASVQGAIDPQENEAHAYQRGWTDPIFTRRAWRRRGLASALLGRSLRQLRERGMTSAQLGVDSQNENRALALYERHRYAVDRSTTEWQKPLEP